MQAKDITDNAALEAIHRAIAKDGRGVPASLWNVEGELIEFPRKVVAAKMRSLIRRGVITGCDCGKCRGDYAIVNATAARV